MHLCMYVRTYVCMHACMHECMYVLDTDLVTWVFVKQLSSCRSPLPFGIAPYCHSPSQHVPSPCSAHSTGTRQTWAPGCAVCAV